MTRDELVSKLEGLVEPWRKSQVADHGSASILSIDAQLVATRLDMILSLVHESANQDLLLRSLLRFATTKVGIS